MIGAGIPSDRGLLFLDVFTRSAGGLTFPSRSSLPVTSIGPESWARPRSMREVDRENPVHVRILTHESFQHATMFVWP